MMKGTLDEPGAMPPKREFWCVKGEKSMPEMLVILHKHRATERTWLKKSDAGERNTVEEGWQAGFADCNGCASALPSRFVLNGVSAGLV